MTKRFFSTSFRTFALLVWLLVLPAYSASLARCVKWHAGLSLGGFRVSSIATWRDALSQPWHLDNDPVSFVVGNGSDQAVVDSCNKLFSAVDGGMHASGPDQVMFEGWAIKCEAVRILVDGAAPQKNFVGDFSLDEKVVCALPVGMAFVVSPGDERKIASIKSRGGTLGGFSMM